MNVYGFEEWQCAEIASLRELSTVELHNEKVAQLVIDGKQNLTYKCRHCKIEKSCVKGFENHRFDHHGLSLLSHNWEKLAQRCHDDLD